MNTIPGGVTEKPFIKSMTQLKQYWRIAQELYMKILVDEVNANKAKT
jgi:lysyl-tRNA synthetase class II